MPPVLMRSPEGDTVEVAEDQVSYHTRRGYAVETPEDRATHVVDDARKERLTSPSAKVTTGILSAGRLVTAGGSDVLADAWGLGEDVRALREANPITDMIGTGVGLATGVGAVGVASRAGSAVGRTAEGASTAAKLGRATAGAATEGALFGAGSGVSEVALSADPLTIEQAVSTIGSHAFFGGAVGGAAGLLAKGAGELGRVATNKLDDVAAKGAAASAPVDDVARKTFVDDVTAFRKGTVDDELFAVVQGAADRETRTIAKTWLEADKAIDRFVVRNPKALASDPKKILTALQQQEHALETIANKADDLRAKLQDDVSLFAMSSQGKVAQAKLEKLDKIAPALEQNRALQARIGELTAKPVEAAAGGLGANMLGGQAFGLAASVVGAIPVVGPLLAPLAGAAASKAVTDGLGKMAAKQAARMSTAIKSFMNVAERAGPAAPVLASKVLSATAYGERKVAPMPTSKAGKTRLADSYKTLTDEVKRLTAYDATGRSVMRTDQRARVFDSLAPVRAQSPRIADQIETIVARRVEAIANRIPRRPDVMSMRVGPDRWQPSDLEMRGLARYVAAVEDPAGVFERVAAGTVTPEDASAMKEVYPEMYADYQRQVFTQLPTLRKTLPYQKRLALSIFSGVPVDPAMSPQVISVLQASYAAEDKPTMPSPQFGSVKNHEATPAEQRQGVGES